MPRLQVRVYATLQQYLSPGLDNPLSVQLPPGASVRDLLAHLQIPVDQVKQVFVNYHVVPEDYVFQEGDRVGVFPPVAGG